MTFKFTVFLVGADLFCFFLGGGIFFWSLGFVPAFFPAHMPTQKNNFSSHLQVIIRVSSWQAATRSDRVAVTIFCVFCVFLCASVCTGCILFFGVLWSVALRCVVLCWVGLCCIVLGLLGCGVLWWCGVIVVVWCYCGGVVFLWWCSGVFVVAWWCFCGGVLVVFLWWVFVVFLWWCFLVVFLWWCFMVVFLCWCFCAGVFVLVFLRWCFCAGVCVVVFLWWCFCGVVGWCLCGGVVVFLWWCLCGDVFVVVWSALRSLSQFHYLRILDSHLILFKDFTEDLQKNHWFSDLMSSFQNSQLKDLRLRSQNFILKDWRLRSYLRIWAVSGPKSLSMKHWDVNFKSLSMKHWVLNLKSLSWNLKWWSQILKYQNSKS